MSAEESLEFLAYLEQAAERMVILIDQWYPELESQPAQ
jgi:hypothetical protein